MRKYLILFLFISSPLLCCSQGGRSWLAIETDPVTTMFGAKTLSLVAEPDKIDHWSLFLNVVSADFPDWMDDLLNPRNKGEGFDSEISIGGGFAIDYFLDVKREGYYIGLINLFFNNQVLLSGQSRNFLSHNIIPRVGYRWYPFEKANFYINPFLGIRYEYLFEAQRFEQGQVFKAAGFGPFGTVHIGYHF